MRAEQNTIGAGCAEDEDRDPQGEARTGDCHTCGHERARLKPATIHEPDCRRGCQRQADQRMRRDLREIPNGWIGKSKEICRIEEQHDEAGKKPARAPRAEHVCILFDSL